MLRAEQAMPDAIVRSMAEAAEWILKDAVETQASQGASVSTTNDNRPPSQSWHTLRENFHL